MPKVKPIIPCELSAETKRTIEAYVHSLQEQAPNIGDHGLSAEEFWKSGLFRSAVEKLRGTQAATMEDKRGFIEAILNYMKSRKLVAEWSFRGSGERHDYEVALRSGKLCVIESKGCLDGNNTNIFERPPNADEFVIWSLCQNPGADPRKNAWSGIHTRLSAEVIHRRQRVDGLIIWDMICGTKGRPCPKMARGGRVTPVGAYMTPPPCIYLFPRTLPDPRNNPTPDPWHLKDISFLAALGKVFGTGERDAVRVHIEARMNGSDVERRTRYYHLNSSFYESKWTKIKRAR